MEELYKVVYWQPLLQVSKRMETLNSESS